MFPEPVSGKPKGKLSRSQVTTESSQILGLRIRRALFLTCKTLLTLFPVRNPLSVSSFLSFSFPALSLPRKPSLTVRLPHRFLLVLTLFSLSFPVLFLVRKPLLFPFFPVYKLLSLSLYPSSPPNTYTGSSNVSLCHGQARDMHVIRH